MNKAQQDPTEFIDPPQILNDYLQSPTNENGFQECHRPVPVQMLVPTPRDELFLMSNSTVKQEPQEQKIFDISKEDHFNEDLSGNVEEESDKVTFNQIKNSKIHRHNKSITL